MVRSLRFLLHKLHLTWIQTLQKIITVNDVCSKLNDAHVCERACVGVRARAIGVSVCSVPLQSFSERRILHFGITNVRAYSSSIASAVVEPFTISNSVSYILYKTFADRHTHSRYTHHYRTPDTHIHTHPHTHAHASQNYLKRK